MLITPSIAAYTFTYVTCSCFLWVMMIKKKNIAQNRDSAKDNSCHTPHQYTKYIVLRDRAVYNEKLMTRRSL